MAERLHIVYDPDLIERVASDFDLRKPNKNALKELVQRIDEGEYDPAVMQVMNLATGVGKTYLMAAFVEYLRLQGVGNVVIVTPGRIVQAKTRLNFIPGSNRFIAGAAIPPDVVTPQDYSAWIARMNGPSAATYGQDVPTLAFVFNIQQLIAPKSLDGATKKGNRSGQLRPRKFDESAGVLFDYLKNLPDLAVIADESHLYSESAVAFSAALRELDPSITVGLTASPLPDDEIVYTYPLYQAIADEYVKRPVLAFRKEGYADDLSSEEQQLHDAVQLREIKQRAYDRYADLNGRDRINAILFVVCSDTDHATQVAELLRTPRYFGSQLAVLQVDSNHEDDATQTLLENVDSPGSPVLAVVSVNKLKEGWDVKNIGVVVTLRAMASEVLTQQTMGRGLRLPFGSYTGVPYIDQLDIIAHQSFEELLRAENVLVQFGLEEAVSESGKASFEAAVQGVAGDSATGSSAGAVGVDACGPSSGTGGSTNGSPSPDPSNSAVGSRSESAAVGAAHGADGPGTTGALFGDSGVGVRTIDGGHPEQPELGFTTVGRNPRFSDVEYFFPCTHVEMVDPEVRNSDMPKRDIPEEEIDASDEGGKERETDPTIRRSLLCVLVCVFLYFMSQNAISSGFSRYADAVWGMQGGSYAMVQTAATLAALVAYMPMASVACHIGRKRTTYIGLVFMVVGCLLISLSTTFSPIVYLWTILFGIGTATVSLTIYPMIVELASTQTTGRYTGYYYTASMAAQVITPILSGAVMQFVGYAQLYLYGATFAALAIIPVLFVRHGDTLTMGDVRERQASWEAEHAEASA